MNNNIKYNLANINKFPCTIITGIYLITCLINGKQYVGQSIYISKRIKEHINNSKNPNANDYNCLLHQALRKYCLNNFVFEIIESYDIKTPHLQDLLNERETANIVLYDTFGRNKGYNMDLGGVGFRLYDLNSDYTDIINDRKKGLSLYKLSIKYKISEPTLSTLLKAKNVDLRKDLSEFDDVVKLLYVTSNLSIQSIAKALGCSNCRIQKSLARSNTPTRNPPKSFLKMKPRRYETKPVAEINIHTKQIIKIYPSITAAAQDKGLKSGSSISQIVNKNYINKNYTAAGSYWTYLS